MMALKHHHRDMTVAAAATTDEDDAQKLLYLEGFSCFQGEFVYGRGLPRGGALYVRDEV